MPAPVEFRVRLSGVAATNEAETRQKAFEPLGEALEVVDVMPFDTTDDRLAALGCAHRPETSHCPLVRGFHDTDDHGMVSVHPGKQERFRLCEGCQHVFNPVLIGSS